MSNDKKPNDFSKRMRAFFTAETPLNDIFPLFEALPEDVHPFIARDLLNLLETWESKTAHGYPHDMSRFLPWYFTHGIGDERDRADMFLQVFGYKNPLNKGR